MDKVDIGYVMKMSKFFIVMHVLVTCNTTLNTIDDFTCANGFRDGMKLPLESVRVRFLFDLCSSELQQPKRGQDRYMRCDQCAHPH